MPRPRPVETLADRISHVLKFTGGTMPVAMLVADEDEKRAALLALKGRKHNALIEVLTEAEADARHRAKGWKGPPQPVKRSE